MTKSRTIFFSLLLSMLGNACSSDEAIATSEENKSGGDSLILDDRGIIYSRLQEEFYLNEFQTDYEFLMKTHAINKEKETEDYILFTYWTGAYDIVFHFIFDKNEKKLFRDKAFTRLPVYNGKSKNDNTGILFMDSGHSLNGFLEYINSSGNDYAIEDSAFIEDYFSFFYEKCTFLTGQQLSDKVKLRSDDYRAFTFSDQNNVGVEFNSDLRKYILILEFVAYRSEVMRNQPRYHALTYYLYLDNEFFFPHLDSYQ